MCHLVIAPDTNLHDLLGCVWNEVDMDIIIGIYLWNLDSVVEKRNAAITINDPGLAQAKDILGRSEGLGQRERTKQGVASFPGLIEANAGDLFGGGVDLVLIVAMHFFSQDGTNIFHCGDVL